MKDLKLAITIIKSAKDIFDFTLNPNNTPKWIDFIDEEETNEWPAKLGTIYRNRVGKDAKWSEFELTEYEPDKAFTMSSKDSGYHVRYVLKPHCR